MTTVTKSNNGKESLSFQFLRKCTTFSLCGNSVRTHTIIAPSTRAYVSGTWSCSPFLHAWYVPNSQQHSGAIDAMSFN